MTRLRPTWRGLCVAAVAVVLVVVEAVAGETALLLVVVGVALPLAVAPVLALRRARRASGIRVHVMVAPPLVPVGGPSTLLLQLGCTDGLDMPPVGLERPADHSRRGGPPAPLHGPSATRPAAVAPDVGRLVRWDGASAGQGASASVSVPTGRRGVFTIGPLQLWVHDPFALFGLPVATAGAATLVVHPSAVRGTVPIVVRPGASGASQHEAGPSPAHADDPGGEWNGLRPYEPGDRLHLLSWQAEARSGALLVHDFRPDSEDVVTIVLDDRAGVHRQGAFEQALGVLYGLAASSAGPATDYDISTLSGRRVHGSTTPEGLVALATFLAETQPTHAAPRSGPPAPSGSALVVTTPTAVPTLAPALRRGSVVVVE